MSPLIEVVEFLSKKDELKAAKTLLDAFSRHSYILPQFDELGMLYKKVKAYPESLEMIKKCEKCIDDPKQILQVYSNYAKVYCNMNCPDEAIHYTNMILDVFPNDQDALMENAFAHYLKNDTQKSYEIQKSLLESSILEDTRKRLLFNMGTFDIMHGHFKSGIKKLVTIGRDIKIYPTISSKFPRWNGNLDTKSKVAVYAESGIGDEIINIRFMKRFQKHGIEAVYVGFREDLVNVFIRNGFNAVLGDKDLSGDYVMCETMSLPYLLDIDEDDLWHGPYLQPDPKYIEKWKTKLPEKFMTVRWSGNPYYDHDLHRVIDSKNMIDTFSKYNIPLVSLQIDEKNIDPRLLVPEIESWEDTLAIQYLAWMNITSCTSTGHSASAMNVPCIVMPPIATYYTWLHLKEDKSSWWYSNNTRIYRQEKHKDWSGSFTLACEHIEEKLNDEVWKNSGLHNTEK